MKPLILSLVIFSTVLIIFFDLFKSSILYSGIIRVVLAIIFILKGYFFSKYSISFDNFPQQIILLFPVQKLL